MSATPCGFVSAYVNHRECELFLEGAEIVAYVPCKATWECQITLGTASYTATEIVARAMGLEPTWN
jgi:hypothetical protein